MNERGEKIKKKTKKREKNYLFKNKKFSLN